VIPFDLDDQDEEGSDTRTCSADASGLTGVDDADDADDADDDDAVGGGSIGVQQARQFLQDLSKDELIAFVERLAAQDPGVQQALLDHVANARGPTADLLRGARITVDNVSAEAIYEGAEPSTGELERLRARFDALLARGRADDVLMLSQRLLRHANHAVEAMEEADDGFFAAIHHVLEVVPEALARSSKGPVDQLLWLYEFELSEDYDLLPSMADFWDQDRPAEVWSELATRIEQRIAASEPVSSSPHAAPGLHRQRDAWSSLLADALENAGRGDEIVQLYEREAEATGSYQRLVTYLLGLGDLERAEHWIRRGIAATPENLYGVTGQLRQSLRTVRERQSDLAGIAALDAYEFCSQPGIQKFQTLLASAGTAGQHDLIRLHALQFLETLILPWKRPSAEDGTPTPSDSSAPEANGTGVSSELAAVNLPPWPLPPTGLPDPVPYGREQPPLARVLLDIALAEHRLDDVLFWFDRLRERRSAGYFFSDPSAAVARAVERSHPDRAIAIWNELALRAIAQTNTSAYVEAARYLEHAGRIEERRGNLASWRTYVEELKARERRKWRLRETLDGLLKRFPPP
jgi:uncharacterized Zn finger protein